MDEKGFTYGLVTMVVRADVVVQDAINCQVRMGRTTEVGVLCVHHHPGTVGRAIRGVGPISKATRGQPESHLARHIVTYSP